MAYQKAIMIEAIVELCDRKNALLQLYNEMESELNEKEHLKEVVKEKARSEDHYNEMHLMYVMMVDAVSADLARMRSVMDVMLSLDRSITEKLQVVRGLDG